MHFGEIEICRNIHDAYNVQKYLKQSIYYNIYLQLVGEANFSFTFEDILKSSMKTIIKIHSRQ